MQVSLKLSVLAVAMALTGCANLSADLDMGWYKHGISAQEFNQDKFACMSASQMQVSTSAVNGQGPTYYGGGNITCNTYGSMTNCSGGGGYSQPGYVSGSSASYVTTNAPLFQACMQARGYEWMSQAEADSEEEAFAQGASPATQAPSDDTTGGSDVDTSDACPKFDALNKGLAAGTVTQQQFNEQFQPLMKACDGASPTEQISSSEGTSGSDVDTSGACRKLDELNKEFAAGTVTEPQFDAQFQALMKACDGTL